MKHAFVAGCMFILGSAALVGCVDSSSNLPFDESIAQSSQALEVGEVIVYEAGHPVDQSELSPLDPAAFGGEILDEGVEWSGRIDMMEGSLIAGVFQATEGKYRVVYPGAVHGTIKVGNVSATVGGVTHNLQAGDAFFVTKGTEVIFETHGQMHQASFMGNFASPDMPGQFIVYEHASAASEEELVPAVLPEGFEFTVYEGDPSLRYRIDYATGNELAGIIDTKRSDYLIHSTVFTEYGSELRYPVTITSNDGVPHTLMPGDAYLFKKGGELNVEIPGPSHQHTLFAVDTP